MEILYWKQGRRMPVRHRPVIYPRDIQQDIPARWCEGCQCELYRPGQTLCSRCQPDDKYQDNFSTVQDHTSATQEEFLDEQTY